MNAEPDANSAPWTLARLLRWTTDHLAKAGVEEARLSAELLLAHAVGCRKIELYTRHDTVPDESRRAAFRDLVRRAAQHTPIAYLVGHKEFYSLDLEVTPDVLIPRPETELLVERVTEFCRSRGGPCPVRFVDIGTGSGCIAVALLSQSADTTGVGTDVSEGALRVAERNRDRHNLRDRLTLVCVDGLDLPREVVPDDGFDLLVSNPPYVAADRLDALSRTIREYEPRVALTDGNDGLEFYRLFARRAHEILASGGSIFVEIGYDQHSAVVQILAGSGRYAHAATWRDPGSPHDRVVHFVLKKG